MIKLKINKKADDLGIKKPTSYTKIELIKEIQRKEASWDCFNKANHVCDRMDCCWRIDCLKIGFVRRFFCNMFECLSFVSLVELDRYFGNIKKDDNGIYKYIEKYVLACFAVGIAIVIFILRYPQVSFSLNNTVSLNIVTLVMLSFAIWRLIDIFQVIFNGLIFDRIRSPRCKIASPTRSLILALVNYIETILLFGILVFIFRYIFNYGQIVTIKNAIYYTILTMFTFDFHVLGVNATWIGKIVSISIAGFGLLFLTFVVSRIMAILKTPDTYTE